MVFAVLLVLCILSGCTAPASKQPQTKSIFAHALEGVDGHFPGLFLAHLLVGADHLHHLLADLEDRVQGRHGVLENGGNLLAAELQQLLVAHGQDVPALEEDLAVHDAPGAGGQQADEGVGGNALTRARLAHDAQDLAAVELKADAVHRLGHAAGGIEIGLESADSQQSFTHSYLLIPRTGPSSPRKQRGSGPAATDR